jgi:hypothetical protein
MSYPLAPQMPREDGIPARLCCAILLALLWGQLGCARNPNLRAHRAPDGRLTVEGPMAGPFKTTEEMAAHACEIMTSQSGAASGMHGTEYCALSYYAPDEEAFYLSYLSDFKDRQDTRDEKTCSMPEAIHDPKRLNAIITAGNHTHPHNPRFSFGDLRGTWRPARAVDPKTGRVFHRELYLFYLEKTGECRAYSYNYATRIVSALRHGQWVQIGEVYDNSGNIRMLEGKDWLP